MKKLAFQLVWVGIGLAIVFTVSAAMMGGASGAVEYSPDIDGLSPAQMKVALTEDEAMTLAAETQLAQAFFTRISPTKYVVMIDGADENGYYVYVGSDQGTHTVRAMTLFVSQDRQVYEQDIVTSEFRSVK